MSDFFKNYYNKLKKKIPNPELELKILLNKCSINNKEIILSNFKIQDINKKEFYKAFNRRIKGEPISKIFKEKNFWKYKFFVDENVLDPRPETELIIEKILEIYPNKNQKLKVLDMCTGSGCLAISIAKEYRNAKIKATDISVKALEIAKINAFQLNCKNQINFVECDLLDKISTYNIVVCNPPYLSKKEYYKTSLEIQNFEPKIAFIAKNEGIEFYEKISKILPKVLNFQSNALIEIGFSQAEKVIKLFKKNNILCTQLIQDMQKLDRLIILNKS